MTSSTRTHLTSVHTVAVPVTDQDRALAFYAGVLGCEVRLDGSYGPGARWLEVALALIQLSARVKMQASVTPVSPRRRIHASVECACVIPSTVTPVMAARHAKARM